MLGIHYSPSPECARSNCSPDINMLGLELQEIAWPGAAQDSATIKFLPFVSDRPFLCGEVFLGRTLASARRRFIVVDGITALAAVALEAEPDTPMYGRQTATKTEKEPSEIKL